MITLINSRTLGWMARISLWLGGVLALNAHASQAFPQALQALSQSLLAAAPSNQWQQQSQHYFQQLNALVEQQATPRLQAILSLSPQQSMSRLTQAVDQLTNAYQRQPEDLVAMLYAGYGQLFLSQKKLEKKDYLQAAELAKLGFFLLDQAAETHEDDWRLRYLRLRMDAFVPADNGRCVVALADSQFLLHQPEVPTSLHPLLLLMRLKAQQACGHPTQSTQAQLIQQGEMGRYLQAYLRKPEAPDWLPVEIKQVLQPLFLRTKYRQ